MESVFMGRDPQLLPLLFDFYAPRAKEVRDVTANRRRMWKGVSISARVLYYDSDPGVGPDVTCRWDSLPDTDGSVDVLVYDPPHLPSASASPKSHRQMVADYGLAQAPDGDSIAGSHRGFLAEAVRVLTDDGLIFAKIKDHVHNHRYQWVLREFTLACEALGLTPCDLIIKRDPCGGNLKSGRWIRSHHARNVHCYWVVIRKGRCEPKRR
jgi:hypothetical protein